MGSRRALIATDVNCTILTQNKKKRQLIFLWYRTRIDTVHREGIQYFIH